MKERQLKGVCYDNENETKKTRKEIRKTNAKKFQRVFEPMAENPVDEGGITFRQARSQNMKISVKILYFNNSIYYVPFRHIKNLLS